MGGFQEFLESLDVKSGDVVTAVMPNIPETLVALLATASLGAVWSAVPPELGVDGMWKRLQELNPKVILAVNGYVYGGKTFSKGAELKKVVENVKSVRRVAVLNYVDDKSSTGDLRAIDMEDGLGRRGKPRFVQVAADHPLWVLFTSGTTGRPKGIVHGHGGIAIEAKKVSAIHMDVKPTDRVFFFSSTGWVAWNRLIATLSTGGSILMYDGNPLYPSPTFFWEIVDQRNVSYLGLSSPLVLDSMRRNFSPKDFFKFRELRSVGVTAAPLPAKGFSWLYTNVKEDVWVASMSGGTEVFTDLVGGVPTLPVYAGEIQRRCLGMSVEAFDEKGKPVRDEPGELVITIPFPSMPLHFLNDPSYERYMETYFSRFNGVWSHGDLIEIRRGGGCVIYGRSDSTIKRKGVRIGTGEIYEVVESLQEVADSLAVGTENKDGETIYILFVVTREGELTQETKEKIRAEIKARLSPRHVPDYIVQVKAIPRTTNGKKVEVPVKRALMGAPMESVVDLKTISDPKAFEEIVEVGKKVLES
ncbi:acetoacetyl-CoA synthetase [Sulfodiicoccus acidiphilus]|uniref:Acetoacetyl-CoA synthetase n=1 Tax=Sulfodiicoccus acidiphilus TaxID=1670455 RepID=A0A348B1I5_9CREN|nr:acetoacetate--CoA ligase [Sulfodiicoccus acidiphilus]BBD72037.1 acetoacetyl-CoA synthetase [Sulfodiicoccus acidiphilus]